MDTSWSHADQIEAMSMGYLVADIDGTGQLEIQRYDDCPCGFKSDEEALEFVKLAAAFGNDLEMRALKVCRNIR